jgi:hypothetical protein
MQIVQCLREYALSGSFARFLFLPLIEVRLIMDGHLTGCKLCVFLCFAALPGVPSQAERNPTVRLPRHVPGCAADFSKEHTAKLLPPHCEPAAMKHTPSE